MTYEVHIRRGWLINDDPQKRCYNGCYYKSHMEWEPWKKWLDCPDKESADRNVRLFQRGNQQLKAVRRESINT